MLSVLTSLIPKPMLLKLYLKSLLKHTFFIKFSLIFLLLRIVIYFQVNGIVDEDLKYNFLFKSYTDALKRMFGTGNNNLQLISKIHSYSGYNILVNKNKSFSHPHDSFMQFSLNLPTIIRDLSPSTILNMSQEEKTYSIDADYISTNTFKRAKTLIETQRYLPWFTSLAVQEESEISVHSTGHNNDSLSINKYTFFIPIFFGLLTFLSYTFLFSFVGVLYKNNTDVYIQTLGFSVFAQLYNLFIVGLLYSLFYHLIDLILLVWIQVPLMDVLLATGVYIICYFYCYTLSILFYSVIGCPRESLKIAVFSLLGFLLPAIGFLMDNENKSLMARLLSGGLIDLRRHLSLYLGSKYYRYIEFDFVWVTYDKTAFVLSVCSH